ncbi:MAG: 2-hydroxymuconate tautomerase family protein [Methanobacteriaceae archaeon]|nr:2-hydroxymuconate tautomerase family protein [Methanobacteriaceae archaeon]
MPVITIYGNEGISKDEKRKMVKEVTKTVAEAYKLPEETITILINALPHENIGVSGELLSDREK